MPDKSSSPLTFCMVYHTPAYDAALPFFTGILGWTLREAYDHRTRRGAILQVREGIEVEIVEPKINTSHASVSLSGVRVRLGMPTHALCEAEYHRLVEAGVEMTEAVKRHPWGETSFSMRAPDGLIITLYATDESAGVKT